MKKTKAMKPDEKVNPPWLSFLESIFFALIEEIRFGAAEIDNLGTSVSIFLLYRALLKQWDRSHQVNSGKAGCKDIATFSIR